MPILRAKNAIGSTITAPIARDLIDLANFLVSSPDPELACEGRALLRSAAFLYTKAGDEAKAKHVTETVEQLSRIARQNKIKHRVGVK